MLKKNSKRNKQEKSKEVAGHNEVDIRAIKEDNGHEGFQKLSRATPEIMELISPSSFERGHENYIKVGDKFVRNFFIVGWPKSVYVTQLSELYDSPYHIDVSMRIEPTDTSNALEKLTNEITENEANLAQQREKGKVTNDSRLQAKIDSLKAEKAKLEQNVSNAFQGQMGFNLTANSLDELDKQSARIKQVLHGKKFKVVCSDFRQDEGFKTVLPFGEAYVYDKLRNFNTAALEGLFPYYNAELRDPDGVYLGSNLTTGGTPATLDLFNSEGTTNHNVVLVGASGSGKTSTIDVLMMRLAAQGVATAIIDPEGEHENVIRKLHGANITLGPRSNQMINVFELNEEVEIVHGQRQRTLDVKSKVSDVIQILTSMMKDLSPEEISALIAAVQKTYERFGFKDGHPETLYVRNRNYNHASDEQDVLYLRDQKRAMPTLTDLAKTIDMMTASGKEFQSLVSVREQMTPFLRGSNYDFFDNQTSPDLQNFQDAPAICFNVHPLEGSNLQNVGMNLALSWIWENFVKKHPNTPKMVFVDEAWMALQDGIIQDIGGNDGNNFSGNFIETMSRRIRKRYGGLFTASQDLDEFVKTRYGAALIKNSDYKFFMRQKSMEHDNLVKYMNLTEGEISFLEGSGKGTMLIKINNSSYAIQVRMSSDELKLIGTNDTVNVS